MVVVVVVAALIVAAVISVIAAVAVAAAVVVVVAAAASSYQPHGPWLLLLLLRLRRRCSWTVPSVSAARLVAMFPGLQRFSATSSTLGRRAPAEPSKKSRLRVEPAIITGLRT